MWKPDHKDRLRAVLCLVVVLLSLLSSQAWAQRIGHALCATGYVNCFFPDDSLAALHNDSAEGAAMTSKPLRVVTMQVRTLHGGPLAHRWLEVESSRGDVTIGFGPATMPFIDTGQISIFDAHGNIERIGGVHLPFVDFNYAKPPGVGHSIGKPIPLTIAQSDALIEKQRHRKFIGPYIPIFHDCHTWVCTVQSSVRGKSTLPCYFLFKGYW